MKTLLALLLVTFSAAAEDFTLYWFAPTNSGVAHYRLYTSPSGASIVAPTWTLQRSVTNPAVVLTTNRMTLAVETNRVASLTNVTATSFKVSVVYTNGLEADGDAVEASYPVRNVRVQLMP